MGQVASSPRQTLSYLRELLDQHGIRPQSKRGQNFLIDLNLLNLLVNAAELTKDDLALEIGTGTGSLTSRLAQEAGAVLSVEIDDAFHDLVRTLAGNPANVVFLHADVLKNKNELNPSVLKALDEFMQRSACKQIKLVANLPYAVATPVIANLLLTPLPIVKMVVTVQLEIAERLISLPSTKEYGALAVLVQSLADVALVRRLPPSVFWPRPKVESAIVKIDPRADKRAEVGDVVRLRNFLRDLYAHRRKNLRGALSAFPYKRFTKQDVDQKLAMLGLSGTIRSEELEVSDHLRLCDKFGIPSIS